MRFGPDDFFHEINVPRETREKLEIYADLLEKWQKRINLVSPTTISDKWWRHFYDSAQVMELLPKERLGTLKILDIGSGAGFPGLVLSVMGAGEVHLVESNNKKCTFMNQVIRETGAPATVHCKRIEELTPFSVDFVTSRALATIDKLLQLLSGFITEETVCLFPKGKTWQEELAEAEKNWQFHVEKYTSKTEESGMILKLGRIRPRG
ncbi:16S rRNA (guanine(527)-N(7))-methyltransferase RsmG [Emcibacter nanhaiensis]|uniref:Ribosomal RNA small subunit methyltransferase G n=1 Tax=Emcibacter nanhaiensis TaxID=1505037 RepID=A0A501PMX0_9PROT|nr:16S rRNA (guanine(527)-N(7))-methyltransferase RsmG [Emcibacter nanhaiensis]TPD61427.1 16S rRNA (guanine(527)-N(7))-methyltransferase RsmG [Emcibacter nanhaiensis]